MAPLQASCSSSEWRCACSVLQPRYGCMAILQPIKIKLLPAATLKLIKKTEKVSRRWICLPSSRGITGLRHVETRRALGLNQPLPVLSAGTADARSLPCTQAVRSPPPADNRINKAAQSLLRGGFPLGGTVLRMLAHSCCAHTVGVFSIASLKVLTSCQPFANKVGASGGRQQPA